MSGKARWSRVSWMAGALLPLVVGVTSAANLQPTQAPANQQDQQQMSASPNPTPQFQPRLEFAKNLIGSKVVNDKGERLGTIKDVVLTPDRDSINYVVLARSSGIWGVGDKYFAVPWSQLSVQPDQKVVVLSGVSKADLDKAPGFDKNHWPATAGTNWLGTSPNAGMTPSGSASTPAPGTQASMTAPTTDIQQLRLSKMFGENIQNPQGEHLGKLDNAMVDVNQGKMAYGIVGLRHGFLGMNKDFAAVPWTALNWTSRPGVAMLNVDRETLASIAFNRDNYPDLANPQYSRQMFDRFHVTPYWEMPGQGQNLGYIPGEENQGVNPPSSNEMKAPNTSSNSAETEMIAQRDEYALSYNPDAVRTIHGTVQDVKTYHVEGTPVEGVLLYVRADDGRMIWVQTGPRSFIDSQKIRFERGDPVTVTGSVAQTGRHETIIASQIQTANRILSLRAPDGRPLWGLNPYQGGPATARGHGEYRTAYEF
jgi:sporulation protein YlmC with PRC-barrel domain